MSHGLCTVLSLTPHLAADGVSWCLLSPVSCDWQVVTGPRHLLPHAGRGGEGEEGGGQCWGGLVTGSWQLSR